MRGFVGAIRAHSLVLVGLIEHPCCKMLLSSALWALVFSTTAWAAPATPPTSKKLGVRFEKRADELPTLTLPYGTWQAAEYNEDADVSPR